MPFWKNVSQILERTIGSHKKTGVIAIKKSPVCEDQDSFTRTLYENEKIYFLDDYMVKVVAKCKL